MSSTGALIGQVAVLVGLESIFSFQHWVRSRCHTQAGACKVATWAENFAG